MSIDPLTVVADRIDAANRHELLTLDNRTSVAARQAQMFRDTKLAVEMAKGKDKRLVGFCDSRTNAHFEKVYGADYWKHDEFWERMYPQLSAINKWDK